MVLDYIPCDTEQFGILYDDYREIKRIPKYDESIFFNVLDKRFCKYLMKKGKYKNKLCLKKISKNHEDEIYCYTHRYQEKKCSVNNCKNKCKKSLNICNKHYNESHIIPDKNPSKQVSECDLRDYKVNHKINENIKKSDVLPSEKKKKKINKDILFLKLKSIIIFNYIFIKIKNKKKFIDMEKHNSINKPDNNCLLEFYLSSLKYVLDTTESIYLLKRNINNILIILKNKLSLDINEKYLELVDENPNINSKPRIEDVTNDTVMEASSSTSDYNVIENKCLEFNVLRKSYSS